MESRRAFIAQSLAALLGPAAMSGCRRSRDGVAGDGSQGATTIVVPGSPMPQREPVMRVRVFRARDRADRIVLGSNGMTLRASHLYYGGAGLELRAPVAVTAGEQGWSLRDAEGGLTEADGVDELEFMASDGAPIDLEPRGRRYPGRLRLTWRSDEGPGAFDVVSHVMLERYLPGVLASELFGHWEPEAYRAQAVAARSFACSEHAYFETRRHYDVTDTIASQVYRGEVDRHKAEDAARSTRGMVLAYEARLVPGYYSSCCGGTAARAADAIGPNAINLIAPLDGRDGEDVCTGAPVYQWMIERPRKTFTARLRAYGAYRGIEALETLDRLEAIEVGASNEHGRPTMYRLIVKDREPIELDAERLLGAANFSGEGAGPPREALKSSFVHVEVEGGVIRFRGRGFGHGVGLCQYGAQALAKQGRDHLAILAWYYPGAAVVRAYR